MASKKVLIIPDAYLGDFSGASVAQVAKELLRDIGYTVAIYSDEVSEDYVESDGTMIYFRNKCSYAANWLQRKSRANYSAVLRKFSPDVVFTLGSVTNKNIIFWSLARKQGIKVISKIFMQDFFCYNFYANDCRGLCTRCLDHGFIESLFRNCVRSTDKGVVAFLKRLNSTLIRYRLQNELTRSDAVLASSHQQVEFYVKYGIPREHCFTVPLFFNRDKLSGYTPSMGDYFVFIAQNRIDKGIHLLKDVLAHCNSSIRIIAAYSHWENAEWAIQHYGLQNFLDKGMLIVRDECTWKTDLGHVLAGCRGVINLSIWPSTTEFVLLEALGLKKPVFTFNVGIHPEILISGDNGFIADSTSMMASQINSLANDASLYQKVSQGAYQLFLRLTDWNVWKQSLISVLDL